ncbi:MAG: Ig-like domain-containing protein [Winogradskyella sp.]|nr:Ig-like domain-containing protein [Winogradskyella sp.]
MKPLKNLLIYKKSYAIFLLFISLFFTSIYSQQLAFPSAMGAGAYASGGRGGIVVHVTNLNDSGIGSLRSALVDYQDQDRTIVFDVSGIINLNSDIVISSPEQGGNATGGITLAGQTAPLGGITITGGKIRMFGVDNVIVRYLKFRETTPTDGCLSNTDGNNVIFDHLSASNTPDICFALTSNIEISTDKTIQYCLMAQSKNALIIGDTTPQGDVDYGEISVIRNAYYNISHRIPMKGGAAIKVDAINNIAHNWKSRLIRMDDWDFTLNHIGNYYQGGTNTTNVLKHCAYNNNPDGNYYIYNENNYMDPAETTPAYETDESVVWTEYQNNFQPLPADVFVTTPFPLKGNTNFTIYDSSELKTEVLPQIGAYKYINDNGNVAEYRDIYDTEHINGIDIDDASTRVTAIELPIQTLSNVRPGNFYQSNPHIPEVWFTANVPNGQDHNDLSPNGYTWLEEYLNQVDNTAPVPVVDVTGVDVTPDTAEIFIPDTISLTATITPSNATDQSGVWTSSDESIATVDNNGIVTPIAVGEVTITFTTNDGGFSDISVITVFPEAFEANAGPDQDICQGESVTLSASGGTTYLWSNGETTASIEVSPTVTTTYTVTAFDDFGNSDDDSVTVTVNETPIAEAGNDQTICEGDTVILTASGGTTYLWSDGQTTASISVTPSADTTYTVEVTSNSCSSTDDVTVFVNPLPSITVSNDVTIMEGETTTLSVSGSDNYLWSTGETTASIDVTPSATTTYTVSSTSVNGCTSNGEVTVTVVPELIADAGEDVEICNGEEVVLIASGGINYIWNTGETTAQITVSPNATTTYTVTAEDGFGNTDSDSVTVNVLESPDISVSGDVTIMSGESASIFATGGDNYLWSTGETTDIIVVSPSVTTTYTVVSTNQNCQDTEQVTVTVVPELIADAGDDVEICNGEEVVLTASGGINYTWNTGETTAQITVSPNTTTTYTVTVEDNFGNSDTDEVTVVVNDLPTLVITEDLMIIEGESVQLTVSGASTYQWSTGETSATIIVNPNITTTYTVTGTTATCSSQVQVTVTVEELLVVSAGQDEQVCEDDSYEVVLTATQGDSYLWSTGETTQSIVVSPLSTTTYSVTVTSGIQEDTDDVTVFVNPNPDVVILNGESVDIMSGDFVTLSASGANTYEWNNGATQPNIAVSPSQTTTYEVRGYIGDCYDEKQVTVNVIPEVEADAGEDQEICLGDVVTLTATGGDEYAWSTGETTQSIQVSPTETTEYTVTVFNALDFDEDTVTVFVDNNCNDGVVVDDPVDGPDLEFEFSVYPNPATEYIDIRLSGSDQLTGFYLYDLTGKLIYQKRVENVSLSVSSTTRVDVSSLQPGIYLVKLIDVQRELYKRVIVR